MTVEILLIGAKGIIRGELPQDVLQELIDVCSYRPEDYIHSAQYISGQWDGYTRLFKNNRFPVGLLSNVKAILELDEVPYIIKDLRNIGTSKSIRSNLILRDYQEQIVQKALERGSGLIVLPPGSGKTEIAIEITARLGLPTLFIVPTQEIFYQSRERFKKALNEEIGLIGNQNFEPKRISIALWQTIWNGIKKRSQEILELLEQVNVVIWDEAHHVSADRIYIVSQFCPAKYRYGLTATPYSSQHAELKFIGACGDIIKLVSASDLIRRNLLVRPIIKFVASTPKFFPRWLNWQKIYSQGVVDNTERNALIAREANKLVESGRTTLVLVTHVRHGQLLNKLIPGSVFVSSRASDRRDVVEDFKAGKLKCVVSTPIWDEGLDVPVMNGLVLAGAGKSPVKAVQRVGRGLRPYNGKKDVRIVDINDKGTRYLNEHSIERFKIYRLEPEFVIEGDVPNAI
jgi:superfamily II DNA or RNA helicase